MKRLLPAALVVVAIGLPAVARIAAGPRAARINVRWDPALTSGRADAEASLHLSDLVRLDGSTWRYDLLDESSANIRAIVEHPAVADTHEIDRSAFALSPSAPQTGPRHRLANGDALVTAADRVSATLAIGAALALLIMRRRRSLRATADMLARGLMRAASLRDYLDSGGFPGFLRERQDQVLQELLRDVAQRDVAAWHGVRDVRHALNLILFLFANTGQPLSFQRLTKALAVPTVAQTSRYVSFLEDGYLVFAVPRFSPSFRQRVVAPAKYYAVDVGLCRANSPHVPQSRPLRGEFESAGVPVTHLGGERLVAPGAVAAFLNAVNRIRPSIIHTHLPRADFLGALGVRVRPAIPWICTLHDIPGTHWSGHRFLPVLTRCWKRADLLIAISEAVRQWVLGTRTLAGCTVRAIPYGIDVDRFHAQVHALPGVPPSRGSGRGEFLVCSVGRLEPRKGHGTLIEAMPIILSRVPTARLEIVGHDPWGYGSTLRNLIRQHGLEERVTLAGFQSNVAQVLSRSDVFAFASQTEGFGQVLIEAMAAGKPVVATTVAPISDIVADGVTGWLVEPGSAEAFADKICWLATHPVEAKRMGQEGLARVGRHFTASRMGSDTLAAYEDVLRRRSRV